MCEGEPAFFQGCKPQEAAHAPVNSPTLCTDKQHKLGSADFFLYNKSMGNWEGKVEMGIREELDGREW